MIREPATLQLKYSVQLADRELTEVSMRRPTVGDEMKYAPTSSNLRTQAEEEARYFAHLCGISLEEIKALDMEDYERMQRQYLFFRGRAEVSEGVADNGSSAESLGAHAIN